MNKRYQVFISSTYQDLSEERLEVIKALLELDCMPVGMEYFPAASEDSWSYISGLIEQCDYYIVVVGGRYGSLTPEGISFTQKEYEFALSKSIPTIAFLHSRPGDIPVKKTDNNEICRKKLEEFIAILKRNLCKEWNSSPDLGAVVSRSLTQLIRRIPRTGWIPANQASDPQATEELLELTKQVHTLKEELNRVRGNLRHDVRELSDGAETIDVKFSFPILKENPENRYPRYSTIRDVSDSIALSWEEIFRAISPKIAPTASDQSIRNAINELIDEKYKRHPDLLKEGEIAGRASVSAGSLNIFKIQFRALGLVTIGKEKAEDGVKGVLLWRLTERGEDSMYNILAVRRKN